jgi:hypothetical protein
LNLQIARTYLTATDPEIANRTWQTPMDEMTKTKTGNTHGRGIAQGLEQAGVNQRRNVMRLAVEQPTSLLRREADGQLAHQRQKPMLIVFHTQHQSHPRSKPNRSSGIANPLKIHSSQKPACTILRIE